MRRIAKEMAKAGKQFIPPPKKAQRSRKAVCAPTAALAAIVQHTNVAPPAVPSASFSLDLLANAALMMPPVEPIAVKSSAERRYPLEHSFCRENVIDQLKSWAAASPRNLEFTGFPQRPEVLLNETGGLGIFAQSAIENENEVSQICHNATDLKRRVDCALDKEDVAMSVEATASLITSPRKRRRVDLTLPPPIPGMPMPIVTNNNSLQTPAASVSASASETVTEAETEATSVREGSLTPERSMSDQQVSHSPSELGLTQEGTHTHKQDGIIAANISPPGDTISSAKKFWSPDSSPGTTPVQPERVLSYPLPTPDTVKMVISSSDTNMANFTLRRSQRERGTA